MPMEVFPLVASKHSLNNVSMPYAPTATRVYLHLLYTHPATSAATTVGYTSYIHTTHTTCTHNPPYAHGGVLPCSIQPLVGVGQRLVRVLEPCHLSLACVHRLSQSLRVCKCLYEHARMC